VVRGIAQQHTHSPAGDISHGFPAPRPLVGGPDHLVFLPEDKFTHSPRVQCADSIQLAARAILTVVVSLEAKLEAVLVFFHLWSPDSGEEFNSKSARNQRQNKKR
jgi:hypothetical protein